MRLAALLALALLGCPPPTETIRTVPSTSTEPARIVFPGGGTIEGRPDGSLVLSGVVIRGGPEAAACPSCGAPR